jgi:hypothetical protein
MRRREIITLLGGAAAWPFAARAQQPAMPVVGFLSGASPGPFTSLVAAFRRNLSEAGFIEGQNIAIEYCWAEGQYDRLPALAANLVAQPATVIVATGGPASYATLSDFPARPFKCRCVWQAKRAMPARPQQVSWFYDLWEQCRNCHRGCYRRLLIKTTPTITPQIAADAMTNKIMAAISEIQSSSPSSST